MEISSEERRRREKINYDSPNKNVLAKWEETQNVAIKLNPNKFKVIGTTDLLIKKQSM